MEEELFSGLHTGELEDTDVSLNDRELNELVCALCIAKAREFRVLGYSGLSGVDIWDCLNNRYITGGVPALHVLIEDILSLKINEYMNWRTLSIYK